MTRRLKVKVEGKTYTVEVGNLKEPSFLVAVNGKRYAVEVAEELIAVERESAESTPMAEPSAEASQTPPGPASAPMEVSTKSVIAPMPGKILDVMVEVGQTVSHGQEVCILEAMKMAQRIRSSYDGVVQAVKVAPEQKVDFGAILIVLE